MPELKQYMYRIQPVRPAMLASLGIIIFLAESDDAARAVVENDPAVKHRVMRAELYPYRIALISKTILES